MLFQDQQGCWNVSLFIFTVAQPCIFLCHCIFLCELRVFLLCNSGGEPLLCHFTQGQTGICGSRSRTLSQSHWPVWGPPVPGRCIWTAWYVPRPAPPCVREELQQDSIRPLWTLSIYKPVDTFCWLLIFWFCFLLFAWASRICMSTPTLLNRPACLVC